MSSAQNTSGAGPAGETGRDGATAVTSIPLSEEGSSGSGSDQSIGSLVRDATTHLSTLLRSEMELAKSELASEVRKGVRGSVYFILALAVLAFSMFFLFFAIGELLSVWLPRWAGFGIVFLAMLVTAGLFGWLGYRRVRKIHAPQRTIDSLKDTKQLAHRHGREESAEGELSSGR